MTEDGKGWSFASAREPARFPAAENRGSPQAEHAFRSPATLCGIPEQQVNLYRHLFRPGNIRACPRCCEQAAAAPATPCAQERLHDSVLTAAPGLLRARLLDTLRNGAEISIWVNGPASAIAPHAHPGRITDGAEAARELLATHDRIGIARVPQPSGEFIVLLPQHADPVITFAAQHGSG